MLRFIFCGVGLYSIFSLCSYMLGLFGGELVLNMILLCGSLCVNLMICDW